MRDIEIINSQGVVIDKIPLDDNNWQTTFCRSHFSIAYNCEIAKKNILTKSCYEKKKNKASVSGGGRKPYRQKGTGRARQGSIRNPHYVGGGLAFGPNGDKKHLPKLNKKSKQKAFREILSEKINNKKVLVVDEIGLIDYKTKEADIFLKNISFSKNSIIVLSSAENNKELLNKAFRNLSNTKITDIDFLNMIKIVNQDSILFTKKAFEELGERLNKIEIKI